MIRVVFLDCDGVLNSPDYQIHRHVRGRAVDGLPIPPIDPVCVEHLNALTARTNARIVVSSTWRHMGLVRIRRVLHDVGVQATIVGVTPYFRAGDPRSSDPCWPERGDEIAEWLSSTRLRVESFAILDDDNDMGELLPRLVRTDFRVGLTAADVTRAADLLL